ncbi:MAG: NAD(P)/FAD-dependent oxidoreductase [Phycisphaerales bacterium]|jgi:kynurenine 3-monooxygenase|nr:NAD(P)/FAD-dependent oxidoreductase [Phycisphaerales bacterium]
MPESHDIVIAGAGLAGAMLAAELGKAGHRVRLFERRRDPRRADAESGRSINLAISVRGLHALQSAGVEAEVLAEAIKMPGRMVHLHGQEIFSAYSRDPKRAINSVSRSGLNRLLVEAAAASPGVEVIFEARCVDADFSDHQRPAAIFEYEDGRRERIEADLVIGTDGAFSAIRAAMQRTSRFDFSQTYLAAGYKELTIPPADHEDGPHGRFRIEPNALHVWPHGGSMMIALPNIDGSFTCTLFWPFEGDHSFATLENADDETVRAFFERHYGDAVPHMPTLIEDWNHNPTSPLVTIRCRPWHRGRAVLLGDAAHAIVPFYGQGANASFEDVEGLVSALAAHPSDLDDAITAYEASRIENANAIADLALDQFIDMRDRSGSRTQRLAKKGSQFLGAVVPFWWTPLYDMVSFTRIPYATALAKSRRQAQTLKTMASFLLPILVIVLLLVFTLIIQSSI